MIQPQAQTSKYGMRALSILVNVGPHKIVWLKVMRWVVFIKMVIAINTELQKKYVSK